MVVSFDLRCDCVLNTTPHPLQPWTEPFAALGHLIHAETCELECLLLQSRKNIWNDSCSDRAIKRSNVHLLSWQLN